MNCWSGARLACADSTRWTIRASVVSARRRVTATVSAPWPLMVLANTSSPAVFSTGSDSPVIGAWLTSEVPVRTMPSRANFSPGRTIIIAPGSTRSIPTSRSPASSRTSTSEGARSSRRAMASRARSMLCASSHCAAANRVTTIAASSYSPISSAPATAMTISALMSSAPRRTERHARSAGNTAPITAAATSRASTHHAGSSSQPIAQPVTARTAATAVNQPRAAAPVALGASTPAEQHPTAPADTRAAAGSDGVVLAAPQQLSLIATPPWRDAASPAPRAPPARAATSA